MNPFSTIKGLIIDMDGVLWHGSQPLPGLNEFFDTLRQLSLPFVLATNNASLTAAQYIAKFASFDVTVSSQEILTSGIATASYLAEHHPPELTQIYAIGESGLLEPLIEQGFELTGLDEIRNPVLNTGPDIVVSGLDRNLTWQKLSTATLNIRAGARFYGTNADSSLPTEKGITIGNGSILKALETATGQKPTTIGKPKPIMYQQAMKILNTSPEQTLAIGDRLDTDILGAINTGIPSILVLSGIANEQDLKQTNFTPTLVMQDIREITLALKNLL
jgi:4-nitrophenyl phosphatase